MSAEPAALLSSLQIPYPEWNRSHLRRRVSDPRRSGATARGHRYNASEHNAVEILKLCAANAHTVSLLSLTSRTHVHLVAPQLPLSKRSSMKYCSQDGLVAQADIHARSISPEQDHCGEADVQHQTASLPDNNIQMFTLITSPGPDAGDPAAVAMSIHTTSDTPLTSDISKARQFDDRDRELTCYRCPLILPDLPRYWGVVSIDLDG